MRLYFSCQLLFHTPLSLLSLFEKKLINEKVTRLNQSTSLFQLTGVFFKNVDGSEGKYTGEGVGGIPHGIGVITFKDGGVYKGDMKNGTVKAPGPSLTVATSSAPLRTARNTVRAL